MAETERPIAVDQLGIGSVLSRYSLHVPPNQREYAWKEREIGDLFHDLANAISRAAPEYFLGSIVGIPAKPGVIEIVDGQQRLATTAILLAAIRNYLSDDDLLVEGINKFPTTIDREQRARVPRLRLNLRDAEYFRRRIMENETAVPIAAASHERIDVAAKMAAEHVAGIVRSLDPKNHSDALNGWVDFMEHKAGVILLQVASSANAYKMFETLNARGLRTSQSDLVKNYLFEQAGERVMEAQHKWSSMQALLESLADEDITLDFLRQMLISMYGYLREPDIYDRVERNARGIIPAVEMLGRLESAASDFVALQNPDHEKWNAYAASTRRAIQTLVQLRPKPARPLLLAIARSMEPAEADRSFRLLVSASVRLLIVGGARSGSVEQALASSAKEVSDRKTKTAKDLRSALGKIIPNDAEFEREFSTATVSQAYLARYYLRALESQVKGSDQFPYFLPNDNQEVINLEHILPKEPLDYWPKFDPETAEAYYRRLGNMVLLKAKDNSDLKSAAFQKKKAAYATTPYTLTNQVAALEDWTPQAIEDRQATLARLAVETWPLSI